MNLEAGPPSGSFLRYETPKAAFDKNPLRWDSTHRRLTLVLSIIVNEPSLKEDKDVRQLLTLLAVMTEPNNIDVYFDLNDGGFTKKYSTYLEELQKLIPANKEVAFEDKRGEKEEEATSKMNQT